MPPPEDKPNALAVPGDNFTDTLHSEPYDLIDSSKANLHGKSVFIVGASKGIGRSIAVSYAKAGAASIAIGARSDLSPTVEAIETAVTEIGKQQPRVLQIKIDVTDAQSVDNAVQTIEKSFGQLDIVVHNAGVLGASVPIADSDPEVWWSTWNTNVYGSYLVTRGILPLLLKGGDKQIIYVTSVGAWVTMPGLSAYQPSKLALSRFAEFVNAEYGDKGVVAYSIHPGNVPGTDILGPEGVPDFLKHVFTETLELCGDTLVYLTAEKRSWLAGRYVSATWDMGELMAKKEEIIRGDKLKANIVL